MGLFRAAIVYIFGMFILSIIDKHLDKINTIPIIGSSFGDSIKKFIKKNKATALLISITALEFII